MESQTNDGMERIMGRGGRYEKGANPRGVRPYDFLLRLLAVVTTLTAAIVLVVSNETQTVPIPVLPNLPPLSVPVTAKWQYSSAIVYFLVSNAIACAYAAFSLGLSVVKPARENGWAVTHIVLDLIMVALLFSGNGAAAAIGVVGYKGNSHLRWGKVCNVFGKYCRHTAASFAMSMLGSLVFTMLVVIAIFNISKKS